MTAIIIEDELQSKNHLESLLLNHCPFIHIVGVASSVKEGFILYCTLKPELIFLDIELGESLGFDLLTLIGDQSYSVIFTTAHEQYGIRAIKFSALDYLLKPIEPSELIKAVQKAEHFKNLYYSSDQVKHLLEELNTKIGQEKNIAIPQSREIRFIPISDIVYCKSSNNYTTVILRDTEKILASKGIYYFDELLVPTGFIRPHYSYLVNIKYIRSIKREQEIELYDKSVVPISKLKLVEVRKILLKK